MHRCFRVLDRRARADRDTFFTVSRKRAIFARQFRVRSPGIRTAGTLGQAEGSALRDRGRSSRDTMADRYPVIASERTRVYTYLVPRNRPRGEREL